MFGYRKEAVDDYIGRLESELQIFDDRSKVTEKQTEELNRELERALTQLRSRDSDLQLLQNRNIALDNEVRDLENQLRMMESQLKQANARFEQLRTETDSSEYSPKQIQDVLLRAQKTADSIVEDAREQAQEIQVQAEDYCRQKRQEGEELISQAQMDAEAVTTQLQKECETLRQDITGVKMTGVSYKRRMKGMLQDLMAVLETIPEMESEDLPKNSEGGNEETPFRILKVN